MMRKGSQYYANFIKSVLAGEYIFETQDSSDESTDNYKA
jgi:hypothetical protein